MKKLIALLAILALTLSGCNSGTASKTTANSHPGVTASVLRVATQPGPQYAPLYVAKEKGWVKDDLAKLGVSVKWTSFISGPPMNEAFAAGDEDIGFIGDTPAIIAKAAGQDNRIVAIASTAPKALAIVVPKNSKITKPADLKGKKVAAVKGSYAHHLLALVLQEAGLTTDDTKFINMTMADIGTSLVNGDIDAGAVWDPLLTNLEDQGEIRVLADGTGIKKGAVVLVARNDFATKNPKVLETFLKTYQRGFDYIKSHPQEAAKLITKDINLKPEQSLRVLPKFDYNTAIHADDIAELKKTEEFMRSNGLIKTKVDIDSFIDTRYTTEAGLK